MMRDYTPLVEVFSIDEAWMDVKVTYGSLLKNPEKGSYVISPAWRPEGIRNVDVK